MDTPGSVGLWQQIDRAERAFCSVANRGCRNRLVRDLFVAVSRLGDGPVWYALVLLG